MKQPNLKSMSVDDLMTLRDRINQMLSSRVVAERRELETRLQRLDRYNSSGEAPARGRPRGRKGRKLGKVPPKYRNPENRADTWTGRGRQPLWVVAALKSGKKMDDLLIAGAPRKTAKKAKKAAA